VFEGGLFVAVGTTVVLTSVDGLTWTPRHIPGGGDLNAVAFGNGSYVAAGLAGVLWQSGPILHLQTIRNGPGLSVELAGPTNLVASMQASTDLVSWASVASLPGSNPILQISDLASSTNRHQFYRATTPGQ
jgi:hypothetical protein